MNLREGKYRLCIRKLDVDSKQRMVHIKFAVQEVFGAYGPESPHLPNEIVELFYNYDSMDRLLRDGFGVDTSFAQLAPDVVDNFAGTVVDVESYLGTIKAGDSVGRPLVKHKFGPVIQTKEEILLRR